MSKGSTLVDEVLGNFRNSSTRNPSWFDRLPPEAQAELEAVKETFDPTVHQKSAFARAVIAAARNRGWAISKERQVIRWLLGDL
jgi:hypothetical protein